LNLKKDSVDLEKRIITISVGNKDTGTTKSKRVRYIPINSALLPQLKIAMRTAGEYMFAHEDGRQMVDIKKAFKRALLKAEIIRPVRFHDLRHSFCSHFIMKGGDIYSLKALAGWQEIKMAERYAHLSPEYLRKNIERLKF
jgi:integrase